MPNIVNEFSSNKIPEIKEVVLELEGLLNPILSPRQPFSAVESSMVELSQEDVNFALHMTKVVAASNLELSYTFAVNVGQARSMLNIKGVRVWLNESLAVYDREGLYPAMQALRDVRGFKKAFIRRSYTCYLVDVKPRLDLFIRGLAGRTLALKQSGEVYTDTEFLYLPESISRYRDKSKNRALYKAMACFLWAQTWYGTFRRDHHNSLSTEARLNSYPEPDIARRYFLALENIRLLANIQRDLPGLYREMSALSPLVIPEDKTWKTLATRLTVKDSNVDDTFTVLEIILSLKISLPKTDYQGALNLREVESNIENRKLQTITDISELLNSKLIDENQLQQAIEAADADKQLESSGSSETDTGEAVQNEHSRLSENSQLNALLKALLQDVNQLKDGLLGDVSLPDGRDKDADDGIAEAGFSSAALPTDKFIELDEWDYLRQNYREKWCQVSIRKVEELRDSFKRDTEKKYPFIDRQIRKVFEAMRDQPRYANRQTDGDEIDLDAVVETFTAKKAGEELSDRMYIRRKQNERSVAVCLLVDMSGSTKGWINQAMRESLIMFSGALDTLGDQYAIMGFSGLTRQRCEIYTVKDFNETNHEQISNRISNIQAKDYTRMGFAVRYATRILLKSDGKHKILILLSDGKPDDYDGYQGEYGIQDTRKAILESQGHAINTFSITIDKQAQAYLPRLFGPGQYMILDDVSTLPLKLTKVYRKLSA